MLADLPRRVRVIGADLALCRPDRPRQQDIHFEPAGMRVGSDERLQARGFRQSGIGHLKEQSEGLADLRPGLGRTGVEG